MNQNEVIERLLDRRQFQDKKWGVAIATERNQTHLEWLAIFTEEIGEVGKAIVEVIFKYPGWHEDNILHELLDVAAVCVAWIEDRF